LSLPHALVAIDPGPVHSTDVANRLYLGFAEQLAGPAGEDVRRAWVVDGVGPTVDDELRKKIIDTMCSVPLPIASAVIEGVAMWNGVAAMVMCNAPLLVLLSRPGGSNDPARLQVLKPDTHFGMTVGAGHFHQLEVPDQVNAMIERFLDVVGA
jgi:hypothetical protein